jgi:pimeloyl-ACP methyl ester carboxylesterase
VDAILLGPESESKGLVVFVHGTGNDLLYPQMSLFKALVSAGYTVFAFDLDGHGLNSSTIFTPEGVRSCLEKSIETAIQAAPNLSVNLIGHSLGGALVLNYLANMPIEIRTAVLISVPLYVPQSFNQFIGELGALNSQTVYSQIPQYGLWNLLPAFGRFKRRAYPLRLRPDRQRDRHPLGYVHEITKTFESLDPAESAAHVDVPTLLLYGECDQIAPLEHGEELFEKLSDCELFLVPGETHFTTILSKHCEGKIISWLNKH